MKATDAKIKRILEKDYSRSVIRDGQEWYFADGTFLDCDDTKTFLLGYMELMKKSVDYAWLLRNGIDAQLGEYQITNNLFEAVHDLGENLSIISMYAELFLDTYRGIEHADDRLVHKFLDKDGIEKYPALKGKVSPSDLCYEIDSSDMPF